jgi:hypothetical protein
MLKIKKIFLLYALLMINLLTNLYRKALLLGPGGFRVGSGSAPGVLWVRSGSDGILSGWAPGRFWIGSGLVPGGFRIGSACVPGRLRVGTE